MSDYMLDVTYLDREMNSRHVLYRTLNHFLSPKAPAFPEGTPQEEIDAALHEFRLANPHEGCTHIAASLMIGRTSSWRTYDSYEELYGDIRRHADTHSERKAACWLPSWLKKKLEDKEPVKVTLKPNGAKLLPWSLQVIYEQQKFLYLLSVEDSGIAFLCSDTEPAGHICTNMHLDNIQYTNRTIADLCM